jgi:hypothetical protein
MFLTTHHAVKKIHVSNSDSGSSSPLVSTISPSTSASTSEYHTGFVEIPTIHRHHCLRCSGINPHTLSSILYSKYTRIPLLLVIVASRIPNIIQAYSYHRVLTESQTYGNAFHWVQRSYVNIIPRCWRNRHDQIPSADKIKCSNVKYSSRALETHQWEKHWNNSLKTTNHVVYQFV